MYSLGWHVPSLTRRCVPLPSMLLCTRTAIVFCPHETFTGTPESLDGPLVVVFRNGSRISRTCSGKGSCPVPLAGEKCSLSTISVFESTNTGRCRYGCGRVGVSLRETSLITHVFLCLDAGFFSPRTEVNICKNKISDTKNIFPDDENLNLYTKLWSWEFKVTFSRLVYNQSHLLVGHLKAGNKQCRRLLVFCW